MSKFEAMFYQVLYSVLRLIANVPIRHDVAWDATTKAWEVLKRDGVEPSFWYWRLIAYHRAVDIIRHEYYRIEKKMMRFKVKVEFSVFESEFHGDDGMDLSSEIQDNLTGCVVEDTTPPPSCEWTWLRENGAIRAVLRDLSARFKRSEWTAAMEAVNDVTFDRSTEEGRREDDRHCQGMTRFRKRATALLACGELPRRSHQFLSEFMSRSKCVKRFGSGRKKVEK